MNLVRYLEAHQAFSLVVKGKLCYTLYTAHVMVCGRQINAVEDNASPNLWHCRLAHMSEKGLKIVVKESLNFLSEGKSLNPYYYCLFGNYHRVSFHKHLEWKENKLELIHSEFCGPTKWSHCMVIDILSPLLMMLHIRLSIHVESKNSGISEVSTLLGHG